MISGEITWLLAGWILNIVYVRLFMSKSQMVRETGLQFWVESYQKLKKMVLDAALLCTQHHKVMIKGKVEQ